MFNTLFKTKEELGLGEIDDLQYNGYIALVLCGQFPDVKTAHEKWIKRETIKNELSKVEPNLKAGRIFILRNLETSDFIMVSTTKTFNSVYDVDRYLIENHKTRYVKFEITNVVYFPKLAKGLSMSEHIVTECNKIFEKNDSSLFNSNCIDDVNNFIKDRIKFYEHCTKFMYYPNGFHTKSEIHFLLKP